MSSQPLTDYEARVVQEIATWKAEPPGLYTLLTGRLTKPFAWALERLAGQLVELASLGAVPGICAVIGTGTNVIFIGQVLKAARCVFQERWLRGNGKIDWVAPTTK